MVTWDVLYKISAEKKIKSIFDICESPLQQANTVRVQIMTKSYIMLETTATGSGVVRETGLKTTF